MKARAWPAVLSLVLVTTAPASTAAQAAEPWWPTSGTVILSGGALAAATSDAFVRKMIELAGGPDAPIVVIPTANPRADSAGLRKTFESRGARHVTILNTLDRSVANSPAFLEPLRSAKAVFFTGGQTMILERAYLGTAVVREIRAVLARGGVLAGDSAGAISLGCAFLTWTPDPFGKRSDEFCALPRVAVSPHANMAQGYVTDDEILGYLKKHRGLVGVDIDQNTVLVLHGSAAETFGDGVVAFVEPGRSASGPWLKLKAGEKADVK